MDGKVGETPQMDTLEAEKVDALQPECSVEEALQGSTVAGASQASQSASQMGNKGCVARNMVASRTLQAYCPFKTTWR